jgi:hypothetical protein
MVTIRIKLPESLEELHLPAGVHHRLQSLLDRQDRGAGLSPGERLEAEGLADLAELLSLLRLRARRIEEEQAAPGLR